MGGGHGAVAELDEVGDQVAGCAEWSKEAGEEAGEPTAVVLDDGLDALVVGVLGGGVGERQPR
ncbi:hypothetical protein ACFQ63_05670 [Streptomyces wedmorensis]|uniref:Uncharacterized protein n=1 Tax=Streptomyces wedmorensis TaxID=43759 RepID=A0ABW6IRD8_STRWE